ncbi:hypothetical protein CAMGR0001_0310 [Campylobacter gracilis RM3268]|uniref:Uncharacterized protein n=1 Tax=Campylobacter gracilis RM3268 TaxID=553220 RepID=C8PKT7_9BACT|nr:hypothetical protein CAMGR0001_0310 [Campylobacter gracilis RM3268]
MIELILRYCAAKFYLYNFRILRLGFGFKICLARAYRGLTI